MAVSVSIAAAGLFIAYLMYYRGTLSPEPAANFAGGIFYKLFDRKYYVDEIYETVFVNGSLAVARVGTWFDQYIVDGIVNGSAGVTRFVSWFNGLIDLYIVDGLVNATANMTYWTGNQFRKAQTGNINAYLYGVLVSLVLVIIIKLRYWS